MEKNISLPVGDTTPKLPEPIEFKEIPAKVGRRINKKLLIIASIIGVILIILGVVYGYAAVVGLEIKAQVNTLKIEALAGVDAIKKQDLITGKTHLTNVQLEFEKVKTNYKKISYLNFTPLRWYYQDGIHLINATDKGIESSMLLVTTIEPYADVIGFTGQGSFSGGTAEDRIVKIIETLDKVTPALDQISNNIQSINTELNYINSKRYPFKIKNQSVEELIQKSKEYIQIADQTLLELKPVLEVLPEVAGVKEAKKYMVMFQNDGEIRPTGGFMTAYAALKVEKGKVSPEKSDDIYELDDKFKLKLDPPKVYAQKLKVFTWHLRDMNVSPDYKRSMDLFSQYYNQLKDETQIQGIIAIDTQFLSSLVKVLGPIEVPGYGVYTAENDPRCDCPNIIYELEDISTRPTPYFRSDRKAILGPMMKTVLTKTYGAPKQIWPELFQTLWDNIQQKHILFYFFDETAQKAVETSNMAGRILPYTGDYLHINATNLGGAKSYMFVSEKVEQNITINDRKVEKVVNITLKNPQKGDNCNLEAGKLCLNGRMPLWMRIYVPEGAVLVDSLGFENNTVETITEMDKTVFEGTVTLDPESQVRMVLTYTIPYQPGKTYDLLMQKQPGTRSPEYMVTLNDEDQKTFNLLKDTEVKFDL